METDHVVCCYTHHFYIVHWFVWVICFIGRKAYQGDWYKESVRRVCKCDSDYIIKGLPELVCIALIIAIPSAYIAANKWLQNYPYRILLSWWLFASAAILVV